MGLYKFNLAISLQEFTQSDYYFFLADVYGDGKIYYSETLTQHNIYKEQYLNGKS